MTWTTRRRPTAVDAVLAAALTLSSQVEIWAPRLMPGVGEVTGSVPVLSVTTLAMTVPLVLRRTAPLAWHSACPRRPPCSPRRSGVWPATPPLPLLMTSRP